MACIATTQKATMRSAREIFSRLVGPARPSDRDEPFTDGAFCKARKRLGADFFRTIFEGFVEKFVQRFGRRFRWKGFHLVGIDGTVVDLPGNALQLLKDYPPASGSKGGGVHPQMLLVAIVDLWTGLVRRFRVGPKRKGTMENDQAALLVPSLSQEDLILADALYPAYDLFCWIRNTQAHFLSRLTSRRFSSASYSRTPLQNPGEYLMVLTVPPKIGRRHRDLPKTLSIRVLEYRLKNGKLLRLATSLLDPVAYPYEELVSLYLERWHQETSHRDWKHSLTLSNLRSRTADGILQEIYLQLTLNNVLRWIQSDAIPPESKDGEPRTPVDLQYKATMSAMRIAAEDARGLHPKHVPALYRELIEQVGRLKISKRRGRSFPRTRQDIVKRRASRIKGGAEPGHATIQ
jgi:hypothetical protein